MDIEQTKALVERAKKRGWLSSPNDNAKVEFVDEPVKESPKPVQYCLDCGARLWPTGCRACARERETKRRKALGI